MAGKGRPWLTKIGRVQPKLMSEGLDFRKVGAEKGWISERLDLARVGRDVRRVGFQKGCISEGVDLGGGGSPSWYVLDPA